MRPFLAAIVSLAVGDPARGDGLFRRNGADVATCDEANAGAGGSYEAQRDGDARRPGECR